MNGREGIKERKIKKRNGKKKEKSRLKKKRGLESGRRRGERKVEVEELEGG